MKQQPILFSGIFFKCNKLRNIYAWKSRIQQSIGILKATLQSILQKYTYYLILMKTKGFPFLADDYRTQNGIVSTDKTMNDQIRHAQQTTLNKLLINNA